MVRILAIVVVLLIVSAGQVHAAIIASDQFLVGTGGYTTATTLNGQTNTGGTFGYFTGGAGGNPTPGWTSNTGAFTTQSTALTHPLVAGTTGNGSFTAPGVGQPRLQYRDFTTTSPTVAPNYYFSLLLNESVNSYTGSVYAGVGESRVTGANATTPSTGFNVGFLNGALTLFYGNGSAAYGTQSLVASPTVNSTYLVTLDYNVGASTITPSVYNASGTLVNTPSPIAVTVASTHMGAFQMFLTSQFNGAGAPAVVNFDEFRFGTALSDVINVAAIPEPGTIAALGMLGVGYLIGRRYRVKN